MAALSIRATANASDEASRPSASLMPDLRPPRDARTRRRRGHRRQPRGQARRRVRGGAGHQGRRRALRRAGARGRRRRGHRASGRRLRRCRASASCGSPMPGARWRWPRRDFIRASRRSSPRSPAPAARPRSPPSPARSGRALGHQAASIGTIGVVTPTRRGLRLADHARSGRAAPLARRAGRRGRHPSGDRSVVARPRPAPARRRAHRGGGFTNITPRSSRLSSELRSLSRRQAAAVRGTGRAAAAPR